MNNKNNYEFQFSRADITLLKTIINFKYIVISKRNNSNPQRTMKRTKCTIQITHNQTYTTDNGTAPPGTLFTITLDPVGI